MPTLRQFEYLVALAEERHFRRAAERSAVTQPTLSAQIRELENSLGVKLVDRSASGIELTPLGREVTARAARVLAEVREIVDLTTTSEHGLHGTLRVGVPATLGPYFLPQLVSPLQQTYPELRLHVREGRPSALHQALEAGSHDLVVTPLPVQPAALEVEPVFREPLRLVTPRDHPLAQGSRISREELAGQRVLTIEQGHHLHAQVRDICTAHGATLLRDYEGTSLDALRIMVGMGLGVAFLPALYVRSEIRGRGDLAVLEVAAPNLYRQIGLTWRRGSALGDEYRRLAELVRGVARRSFRELTILR